MAALVSARHLRFIAEILKDAKPTTAQRSDTFEQWLFTVHAFSKACARANPKFKEHLFLKACAYE